MTGRRSAGHTDIASYWLRGRMDRGFTILAIALAMGGSARAQAAAKAQPELLNAVKACDKDARSLLERTVGIDSGSGDAEGLATVAAIGAAELAAHPGIHGVTITSDLVQLFPPWGRSAADDAIVAKAQRLYAELGRTLTTMQVGSSADISFAVLDGTPGLDGFAMEGADAHTDRDHTDFNTLTPRAYLLARMLMETGHDPKGK